MDNQNNAVIAYSSLLRDNTFNEKASSLPIMVLDSSYARLLQMWGSAAENLIQFKIQHTPNVNHDNFHGHGCMYTILPGGSYADLMRSNHH